MPSGDRPVAFEGLRVVEIASDPAGELVGRLLGQLGADVIKIEPADGSPSRRLGPFAGGEPDPERSLHFWHYNANKRSVVADLHDGEGLAAVDGLLAGADVLVIDMAPPELRRRGVVLDEVADAHPGLVVAAVTPFGLDGPWADRRAGDLVTLATGGPLHMCGYDDHAIPPIRPGGDQGFHTGAGFTLIGILLALLERQRSGRGDVVDVSLHESMAVTVELANPFWFYPRLIVQRQTCRHAQPSPTQPALFQCADGRYVYFALILADTKPWTALVEWLDSLGTAADLVDPAYDDVAHRQANFAHVQGLIEAFFLLQPAEDAYREGQRRGLPIGILNAPEDLFDDEHLEARGFFRPVDHDGVGPVRHPAAPFTFSAYDQAEAVAAPRLGQHTAEVFTEAAASRRAPTGG